jgi:phosphoglucosamine mutase
LATVAPLQAAIAAAERRLAGRGRVLVRYSGTQPLCRVMVEAETEELTRSIAGELVTLVRERLG